MVNPFLDSSDAPPAKVNPFLDSSNAPTQKKEAKPSLSEDISRDIKGDIQNEGDVLKKMMTGERSLPSTAIQTIANVTGPIRDVGSEVAKRIPGYEAVTSAIGNAVGGGAQKVADMIDSPATEKIAQKAAKIAGNHPELIEDIGALGKTIAVEPTLEGYKGIGKKVGEKSNNLYQRNFNRNVLPNVAPSPPKPLPENLFKGPGGKVMSISPKAVEGAHDVMGTILKEDDINPLDVAQRLEEARSTGLPITAADVIFKEMGDVQTHGKNMLGTLKGVANMPGPGASMAGEVASRGYNTSNRLGRAFDTVFSKQGVYEVSDDALEKMATETPKAYKPTFEGGSIAPLEKQFEKELGTHSQAVQTAQKKVADANNRILQIEARKQTNSNIYAGNNLTAETRQAHDALQQAQKDLVQAQGKHGETLDILRQAQADKASGVKGAIWSPRIQEMLSDDVIQKGIKKGLWIAKKEALANGEKFNPTEYGITGMDEHGEPIVSKVPNMRMLDAGKKGLDSIINENKNPLTGKMNETGRAVSMLKNSYVKEIDALNPDYARARQSYGDQAARLEALNEGRNFLKMDKEEISRFMKDQNISKAEKVAFSVGVRRELQDMLDKDTGNPIKSIWRTGIKDKLEPLFPNKETFDRFSKVMEHEQSMHRINGALATGSHTNLLKNFQAQTKNPVKIVKGMMNPVGAASDMGMDMISNSMAKKAAGMNKEQAAIVGRYLTTNDPQLWYDLANRIKQ